MNGLSSMLARQKRTPEKVVGAGRQKRKSRNRSDRKKRKLLSVLQCNCHLRTSLMMTSLTAAGTVAIMSK